MNRVRTHDSFLSRNERCKHSWQVLQAVTWELVQETLLYFFRQGRRTL
jgi:hypothetical protein